MAYFLCLEASHLHYFLSTNFIGACHLQFPIGIDSERFIRALELPQVKAHINQLKERFAGRKVSTIMWNNKNWCLLAFRTYYVIFHDST